MKILVVLVIMLVAISGCANKIARTGTVCITPIVTKGFRTSDPVDIKQDVADSIAIDLDKRLPEWVTRDTKMKIVSDCIKSDMTLSLALLQIDPSIIKKGFAHTMRTERVYGVGVSFILKENKNSAVLVSDTTYKKRKNYNENLDEISEEIAKRIIYDKARQKNSEL